MQVCYFLAMYPAHDMSTSWRIRVVEQAKMPRMTLEVSRTEMDKPWAATPVEQIKFCKQIAN